MGETVVKIIEVLLGGNKLKTNRGIFQFKSFVFFCMILAFFSNVFWNMKGCVRNVISKEVQIWILDISKIASHIFTSLVILSFVLLIISAIAYKIMDKISKNNDRIDYWHRLEIGSFVRFSNSLEDVIIFLMIGCFFDKNFLDNYISVYSKVFCVGLFVACSIEFVSSSFIGIINRFFVFCIPDDIKHKE